MIDGPSIVGALQSCSVTDVVWIPDSALGRWDADLAGAPNLRLLRVCREGEAIAVAAGLHLGGRRPLIMMQCTGLFEAGDSLRNFVHDLRLPLFFLIGGRSLSAHRRGESVSDTCPRFTEPILRLWQIPHILLDPDTDGLEAFSAEVLRARSENRVGAVLLAE